MKIIDIEIAMMEEIDIRQNLTVPNVSWGMRLGGKRLHECDLLYLTKSNYAVEIEIKTSKRDLVNDLKKPHGHDHKYVSRLYYAVPERLKEEALDIIPERAGLYIVKECTRYKWDRKAYTSRPYKTYCVELIKQAKRRSDAKKWTDKQRYKLARLGTMRILNLKKKLK